MGFTMSDPSGPLLNDFDVRGVQFKHLDQRQRQALQVRGRHQQVVYVRSCEKKLINIFFLNLDNFV